MVHRRRLVTLQRDDADFVVTFFPENLVVLRHTEPNALRKVCTGLRWKIINDSPARMKKRLPSSEAYPPCGVRQALALPAVRQSKCACDTPSKRSEGS
jgi:hypothetical protein